MNTIYAYTDYREYIRDFCAEKKRKNSAFSMRCAAVKCGVPSGTFTRIINGTRGIGPSLLPVFTEWLGLKHLEADYFKLLVKFQNCVSDADREKHYREILEYRSQMRNRIPEEKFNLFENWYNVALFELIKIFPEISDPVNLGSLLVPSVSETKVSHALEILQKNGFIKRTENGYTAVSEFLSTGDYWESASIHAFQRTMCSLGTEALVRIPKDERDISTLSISVSDESFRAIAGILREAREKIRVIEQNDKNPKKVYQVNLQLFPVSRDPDQEA
jgi:uncharacterized protein (TIGR02147 family)